MANIIGLVILPLLLWVAVPVGIIALGIYVHRKHQIQWSLTLILTGSWVAAYFVLLPRLLDWLWYMAFGGGMKF